MEKKVTKKAPAKKKTAVVKEVESPFDSIAVEAKPVKKRAVKVVEKAPKEIKLNTETVEVAASPLKKAVKKTAAKSEPGSVATGSLKTKADTKTKNPTLDATAEIASVEPQVELSPVFKALADVTLPELKRENRARLQMQTPTRLYFYWSIKENPYHLLKQTFGDDTGSYQLVVKLVNVSADTEEIHPCDPEGTWWFSVEPDTSYQAEIGFYAPNRPYFRIVYSNYVETPRRTPSPRAATDADWNVSAGKFAEVLDVAGFTRDAFDVAIAGDDQNAAEIATHTAFSQFVGAADSLAGISAEDIRYAMIAIAAGATLEDLRFKIGPTLFAILQANAANLVAGRAISALGEYFDIDEAEYTEEQRCSAVYGASLVNFPTTLKTRRVSSKTARYSPVSSFGLGR